MSDLNCLRCNQPYPADSLLESASGYSRTTDSGTSTCPRCHQSIEFRVRPGVIELGFTYWAGAMHFEAISSHRVNGLRVVVADGRFQVVIGPRSFVLAPSLDAAVP